VPSIAAELWGVDLDEVMKGMTNGHIPSKTEAGFTFVDVAPESPKIRTPHALRETPATYTIITPQEQAMLTGIEPQCEAYEEYLADENETIDLCNWRQRREDVGKTRQRPMAA
jgi:hypothetical protein